MSVYRTLLGMLTFVMVIAWTSGHAVAAAGTDAQARIAVAADFAPVAQLLADSYSRDSGDRIEISAASTGKLYAQIRNGAPFDVLLAADAATPRRLVDEGLAVRTSLYDYATGRLVLWSRSPHVAERGSLDTYPFRNLAIANPDLAPYGAAAREALQHVGRWDALKSQLVLGENVSQATQFVLSGNAEAGLLPRSLVREAQRQVGGSSWLVPASWHRPIVQSAVLLNRGSANSAATGFLKYLRSDVARRIIVAHGYD